MMMKREKVDKQGFESMVASYRYLGVSNPSVWHPGLIPVYHKNTCTLLFSGLRIFSTLFSV